MFALQSVTSGALIYEADATTPEQMTINITSYNATTKELIGTFSGTAKNTAGNSVSITKGSFDVTVK